MAAIGNAVRLSRTQRTKAEAAEGNKKALTRSRNQQTNNKERNRTK